MHYMLRLHLIAISSLIDATLGTAIGTKFCAPCGTEFDGTWQHPHNSVCMAPNFTGSSSPSNITEGNSQTAPRHHDPIESQSLPTRFRPSTLGPLLFICCNAQPSSHELSQCHSQLLSSSIPWCSQPVSLGYHTGPSPTVDSPWIGKIMHIPYSSMTGAMSDDHYYGKHQSTTTSD